MMKKLLDKHGRSMIRKLKHPKKNPYAHEELFLIPKMYIEKVKGIHFGSNANKFSIDKISKYNFFRSFEFNLFLLFWKFHLYIAYYNMPKYGKWLHEVYYPKMREQEGY